MLKHYYYYYYSEFGTTGWVNYDSLNFWLNYPFKHSMTNWKLVCLQKVMTSLDHLKSSSKSATMSQNTATNLSWIVQQGLAICCVGTKPSRAHKHIHTHPGGDQCVLRKSPLPIAPYPSGLAAFRCDVYTLVTQSPRESLTSVSTSNPVG